jgi:hypothetical protein
MPAMQSPLDNYSKRSVPQLFRTFPTATLTG